MIIQFSAEENFFKHFALQFLFIHLLVLPHFLDAMNKTSKRGLTMQDRNIQEYVPVEDGTAIHVFSVAF